MVSAIMPRFPNHSSAVNFLFLYEVTRVFALDQGSNATYSIKSTFFRESEELLWLKAIALQVRLFRLLAIVTSDVAS